MFLSRIRRVALAIATLTGLLLVAAPAAAFVDIQIDLSSQTMRVASSRGLEVWPVSTARSGYVTPRGSYRPVRLERMHYSRKYDMSPMPWSIFFRGGYAIHGTGSVSQLGRPASHGCVRLAPRNASRLYAMVQAEGARITVRGAPPAGGGSDHHRQHRRSQYQAPAAGAQPQWAAARPVATGFRDVRPGDGKFTGR
ncbi:MAG: L,D-transpeptidase [Hyphomicrobiales bacterium]|nr:L,D-transpeptidase [Hyphomicrobiales bacterium]